MFHPKCQFCRSTKTIKWGGGRWRCKRCGRSFRLKRGDVRDWAAIAGYVLDRSTYKRLGDRWGVHKSTACRRVARALARRLPLIARTVRLLRRTDGVLVLDGKHLRVGGRRFTLFVAWDRGLGLPVHYVLAEGGERELWYWKLVLDLRTAGYTPKAFVSDGIPAVAELVSETYAGLPHQRCTVHVFLRARAMLALRGRRTGAERERASAATELLKAVLWSETLALARDRLGRMAAVEGLIHSEIRAIRFVGDALEACFAAADPKWRHLNMPRSSNAIENVIGQVEARLKTVRGPKSKGSLDRLVNELLLQVKRQVTNQ
jgi:DnaJ-domain-containing protein 1